MMNNFQLISLITYKNIQNLKMQLNKIDEEIK